MYGERDRVRGSGNAPERGQGRGSNRALNGGRARWVDEDGEEHRPDDDFAGDFQIFDAFREGLRIELADHPVKTRRQLRDACCDLLATIKARAGVDGDEEDETAATLAKLREAFEADGEEGVKRELEKIESEGIEVAEDVPAEGPEPREWLV